MRDIPKRIIIRLSRIALKQISLFYILHLSICCMISLFFLEKQSEIRNSFTFFEKWKVKKIILSLFLRNEKWNDFFFHSFREVKVKLKYLETEIEKWNFKIILENSRETRLSLVTGVYIYFFLLLCRKKLWILQMLWLQSSCFGFEYILAVFSLNIKQGYSHQV